MPDSVPQPHRGSRRRAGGSGCSPGTARAREAARAAARSGPRPSASRQLQRGRVHGEAEGHGGRGARGRPTGRRPQASVTRRRVTGRRTTRSSGTGSRGVTAALRRCHLTCRIAPRASASAQLSMVLGGRSGQRHRRLYGICGGGAGAGPARGMPGGAPAVRTALPGPRAARRR